uniref:Adenylate kinase 7b n=1 Tax=Gasterosteus aculeatus aculeatus TaxID=481459 RepID=G3PI63_GASAC
MATVHQQKPRRRTDIAQPRMKEAGAPPRVRRVFINHIDSYASESIAQCLSERVGGQTEEEEEEEELEITPHGAATAFHVVGTVSGRHAVALPCVVEAYLQPNREELLSKLIDCDVIIYNITQHAEQVDEALWAVSALHKEMGRFSGGKMFILVSTVMTWAASKPLNSDFTDEHFLKRRPHPNFQPHIDLEKKVVHMGKTKRGLFSTYVVASGLQYGMGEQVFHYFFKTSWLGHETPVFGDGTNIVPTIHVSDLARVILNVIKHQPKPYYLLAVDSSSNTLEQIVREVASMFGAGKVQKRPFEEAYLTEDLSTVEIDSLLVNLRMQNVHLKELIPIDWLCETGLVDNMELVVEEYQKARGLLPLRLCVLGPPAVGKSTVSKQISEYYKVQHITLKETIAETISQLEDNVRNADPDAADENSAVEAKEFLNSLKDSMEQYGGLLDEQLLVKVVRNKLMSPPCRNQGFVLDGFPKTYEQAKELFYAEESQPEDGATQMSSCRRKIMPEFVLCLDASDIFLEHRVMMLPERLVQEHNYEQEHFQRRLAGYRENNAEDETVVNYFEELDLSPLYLEITSSEEPDHLLMMQTIFDTVGQPRNYGPTSLEEEERRKAEEKMEREAQEKAEEERQEAENAQHRAAQWEEWTQRLQEVRQQEEEVLEAESAPLRNYLMEHVMPTLTQGLIACCTARPQDPVDFLVLLSALRS